MLPEAASRRAVRMGIATQHTPWGGAERCGLWEGKGPAGLALGLDMGQGTHSTQRQGQGLEDVQHGLQHCPAPEQVGEPAPRAPCSRPRTPRPELCS